jgi:hypothetical protein
MTTRGGGKEKMTKAVAMLRSGGYEDEEEDSRPASKRAKRSKSKKAEEANTEIRTAELAAIEDTYSQKAEASRTSHPRHWPDKVSGNVVFS